MSSGSPTRPTLSGIDTHVNWSHRFSQFCRLRLRYQFTRLINARDAVFREPHQRLGRRRHHRQRSGSGQLGPAAAACSRAASPASAARSPRRTATRRTAGASRACNGRAAATTSRSAATSAVSSCDILSQQDARGTLRASPARRPASDLADFLLGMPHTSSIAFGNADKDLRGTGPTPTSPTTGGVSPTLTVNARRALGVRVAVRRSARPARRTSMSRPASPRSPRSSPAIRSARSLASAIRRRSCARTCAVSSRARRRLAARARIVAGDPRRLRHLPQHVGLPADRTAAGAAAAAVEGVQRRRTAPTNPLTLANGFPAPTVTTLEHLRRRSRFPRRLRAQLAGARAARSAGVADR